MLLQFLVSIGMRLDVKQIWSKDRVAFNFVQYDLTAEMLISKIQKMFILRRIKPIKRIHQIRQYPCPTKDEFFAEKQKYIEKLSVNIS